MFLKYIDKHFEELLTQHTFNNACKSTSSETKENTVILFQNFELRGYGMSHQPSYVNIFSEDKEVIAYRPKLARKLKSVPAALFLQQVVYRWGKNDRKEFYKFIAECEHPLYKSGDSWQEELVFTRREFENALSLLATKSRLPKKESGVVVDPGLGVAEILEKDNLNSLIAYRTDASRVTWWSLNERLFNKMVAEIYEDFNLQPQPARTSRKQVKADKKPSAPAPVGEHKQLIDYLHNRIGPIHDYAAQGKAVKWLLENGYTSSSCIECLESMLAESWRTTRVSWLNVAQTIGTFTLRKTSHVSQKPNSQAEINRAGGGVVI